MLIRMCFAVAFVPEVDMMVTFDMVRGVAAILRPELNVYFEYFFAQWMDNAPHIPRSK